jgi:hypothetical protein
MKEDAVKLKSALTEQQLSVLSSEMEKYKKSTGLAYVLWFFLGTLGIHKFYIGKTGWGIIYLLMGIIGWGALIIGLAGVAVEESSMGAGIIIAIILLSLLGIFLLIDVFTISRQIRKSYEKKEIRVLQKLTPKTEISD